MVPINHLKSLVIPEYLLWEQDDQYELYLGISDFVYAESGDLDFKKGQLVVSEKIIDSDWMHGFYLDNMSKTGIFPKVCVTKVFLKTSPVPAATQHGANEIISHEYVNEYSSNLNQQAVNQAVSNEYTSSQYERTESLKTFDSLKQARVLYAFSRESDNDHTKYLNLEVGDYILVVGNLDENWVSAENIKGEKGIFPVRYIEYIEGSHIYTFPLDFLILIGSYCYDGQFDRRKKVLTVNFYFLDRQFVLKPENFVSFFRPFLGLFRTISILF